MADPHFKEKRRIFQQFISINLFSLAFFLINFRYVIPEWVFRQGALRCRAIFVRHSHLAMSGADTEPYGTDKKADRSDRRSGLSGQGLIYETYDRTLIDRRVHTNGS